MDCTNAVSMTVNNKGGRFTNVTTGTGGADTHIEPVLSLSRLLS
jgi:hypothetical protein